MGKSTTTMKMVIVNAIMSAMEVTIDGNVYQGETTTGSTKLEVRCTDGQMFNIVVTKAR